MFRYALVTLICFVIDSLLLFVFTRYVFPDTLHDAEKIAKLISNPIAGIVNYLLCSTPLVFGRQQTRNEALGFIIFTIIGVGTLAINVLFLWIFMDFLHLPLLVANVIAYTAGFLWNFFMRRRMVFYKGQREGM